MTDPLDGLDLTVTAPNPVTDILEWATTRPLWQQDALRRLAIAGKLTDADRVELMTFIRKENGLPVDAEPPAMVPLAVEHLGSGGTSGGADTRLLGIREIKHVGRMAADAHLSFSRDGLTAVYGDNGAGKSGYTRILRRAGSGRGDDPKKRILPDVFADAPASDATAIMDIECGGSTSSFAWSAATPGLRIPGLTVFDSDATRVYVDDGNAIELLPFNIDIIQGLIEFCDWVKDGLVSEEKSVADHLAKTRPQLPEGTEASSFIATLSPKTTAQEIAKAATFTPERRGHLDSLRSQIAAPMESLKTLTLLTPLLEGAAPALTAAERALSVDEIEGIRTAHFESVRLREMAKSLNANLLESHDLPVGGDIWRRMWNASREYAEMVLHPAQAFPDVAEGARCPLCQQVLGEEARGRFQRLEEYVSAKILKDADDATHGVLSRLTGLEAVLKTAEDSLAKLDLSKEDPALATELTVWLSTARARRASMDEWLNGKGALAPPPVGTAIRLTQFAADAKACLDTVSKGANSSEAQAAAAQLRELEAWALLEAAKSQIEQRVAELSRLEKVKASAASANTTKITSFFNIMKDRYLTAALLEAYEREITALKLGRLKAKVTPKKDREAAKFTIDLDGRKITTCKLSEVLSEGERRALSLAAFFAEQSIGGGSGCLVFDDPVSSLDHTWAQIIADRLTAEASRRQIIVFTHDLVFYDKLCTATEGSGIPLDFHRLFWRNDTDTSGHVDPTRSDWNSQKVKNRIADLKNLIAHAKPVAARSPGEYALIAKGIYGRMRDTWERLIEELLFGGVVQRFQKEVASTRLKYYLPEPEIIARITAGMTRTSTFSHDNAVGSAEPIPDVAAMENDVAELAQVAGVLWTYHDEVNKKKKGVLLGIP